MYIAWPICLLQKQTQTKPLLLVYHKMHIYMKSSNQTFVYRNVSPCIGEPWMDSVQILASLVRTEMHIVVHRILQHTEFAQMCICCGEGETQSRVVLSPSHGVWFSSSILRYFCSATLSFSPLTNLRGLPCRTYHTQFLLLQNVCIDVQNLCEAN
jgi:hypothetical protein